MVDEPVKKSRQPNAPIDASIQTHIGQQLRAMYEETASEPIPDNLMRLLDALSVGKGADEAASSKSSGSKA
jgi:hypothetical protein